MFLKYQLFSVLILFLLLDFSISAQVGSEKHGVDFVADTAILRSDMQRIMDYGYRNYKNPDVLDSVAYFIKNKFKTLTDSVTEQVYNVNGKDYRNIIASFNANKNERLIIGAHYEVYGDQDGADDNGSAVVGLIRLAQLLKDEKLDFRIDFVAYTLEEPPFFRTENMGSHVHASGLKENNFPVKGMICLESIGYFSDEKGSQTYSTPFHKLTMGTAGNYILVVSRKEDGEFGKAMTNKMKDAGLISTK